MGFHGPWAGVDLQGDDRIDGHGFAAFLETADAGGGDADDGLEEPLREEAQAELAAADGTAANACQTRRKADR